MVSLYDWIVPEGPLDAIRNQSGVAPGDKRHFGMGRQTSQPDIDCVWQETIVGIEEHDEFAGDVSEAFVARHALALVALRDATDPLVPARHVDGPCPRSRRQRRQSRTADAFEPARFRSPRREISPGCNRE